QVSRISWREPALWVEDALTGAASRRLHAVPEPACQAFCARLGIWVTGHRDGSALVWNPLPPAPE
ncbi:MAG: hypothetical protein ABW123_14770, partial [Cystobacter sp.]